MNSVRVGFHGGGFDGREIVYRLGDFDRWGGMRPCGWFALDWQSFSHQGDAEYRDGDTHVTMRLVATSCSVGAIDDDDDCGYDGWLAPCDRYDDTAGDV